MFAKHDLQFKRFMTCVVSEESTCEQFDDAKENILYFLCKFLFLLNRD